MARSQNLDPAWPQHPPCPSARASLVLAGPSPFSTSHCHRGPEGCSQRLRAIPEHGPLCPKLKCKKSTDKSAVRPMRWNSG